MKRALALALTVMLAGVVGTAAVGQTPVIQAKVEARLAVERVAPETPPQAPRHNVLTPQEIAEGWILLFDGESTFGWTAPNGSKWTLVNGMLAPQADKHGLLVTTTAFGDCEIKVQYRMRQTSKVAVFVGCDRKGTGADKVRTGKDKVEAKAQEKEAVPAPVAGPTQVELPNYYVERWTEAQIEVHGPYANIVAAYPADRVGPRFFSARPPRSAEEKPPEQRVGYIALSGEAVIFRDIKVKPINTKPLFNGKNLTGWKKYEGDPKRAKSKFDVTQRMLTIKDGPGDLQTEGQWSDFILQIDCKTNGKNLNSGVFFRCRPGEYQNGYEAQIQNGWLDKPKEIVVEDYDPKTHALKEKRKVQTLAADYGTGAIYRRVPARKEVAKDNEWFTMTVVAQGNHLATWVNGVQVVDWDDNRPTADNARNGCKLEKGPISLQGHDPTTDLAFRNIRIADLAPAKK